MVKAENLENIIYDVSETMYDVWKYTYFNISNKKL